MELFRSKSYKDLPVTNNLRLGFYVFISNGRVGQRQVTNKIERQHVSACDPKQLLVIGCEFGRLGERPELNLCMDFEMKISAVVPCSLIDKCTFSIKKNSEYMHSNKTQFPFNILLHFNCVILHKIFFSVLYNGKGTKKFNGFNTLTLFGIK